MSDKVAEAIHDALKAVAEETARHCTAPSAEIMPPEDDPRRLALVRTHLEGAYLWRTGDLPNNGR